MATSISGLGSGLDTASIISSLMAVEALPQQSLQQKSWADKGMIQALQALNTKVSSLNDLATKMSASGATNLFTATTNSTAVTATAATGAASGQFNVTVDKLAQTQVDVTAAMTTWATDSTGAPSALTVVDSTGRQIEVTPASTSMDDLVAAINGVGGPVTALKVPAGNNTYRVQFTATQSGAKGAFQVYQGTAADVTAGTATDLMADPNASVVTAAQDASARLYAGTSAETTVTSSTNTFTNLLPGVNVTATAASANPVTVTVAADSAGVTKQASDLVDSINAVLSNITSQAKVTVTTNATGSSSASGGLFTGNQAISGITDAITEAAYMPINGHSPSDYGISINQDGSFSFDSAKFGTALAADPAGTESALSQLAARVATAAKNASDPITGSITQLITGQQSEVDDLATQISDWDTRLADRKATLTAMFNSMEVSMGTLKSQQSWLTSQIAGLPSTNSSSSSSSSGN